MSRNGAGSYSLPTNSWNPAVNGVLATAADWQILVNDIAAAIQQSLSADGQTPMIGNLQMGGNKITGLAVPIGSGNALRWEQLVKGSDIASATTLTIPTEGSYFEITGTTTISGFSDTYNGRIVYLKFTGVLTLANSTSFVLIGGQNISTKAGDIGIFVNDASGIWRCVYYPNLDSPGVIGGVTPNVGNFTTVNSKNTFGFKNRIINGGFTVNQRAYVSGAALSAGVYAHDRYKAGSSGCTYTFTQGSLGVNTAITITAGSLQQVIEGCNMPEGGTYVLSWTGTAQARFNGGSYGASPLAVAGITAGANVTVEFNAGTLGNVQIEVGTTATSFDVRDYGRELIMCQRYLEIINSVLVQCAIGGAYRQLSTRFAVEKRTTPTVTLTNTINSPLVEIGSTNTAAVSIYNASGDYWKASISASAEL